MAERVNRVESVARERLLRTLALDIESRLHLEAVLRVAIDGVDGAGKTVLADELAETITAAPVIRASIDDFHNPAAVRYRQGRGSPEGYFRDSFNYPLFRRLLLDPLSPGGNRRYRRRGFDHLADKQVSASVEVATVPSVLLVDGIFLHRPELRDAWDYSVFLEVSTRTSVRRCIERAGAWEQSDDPGAPEHQRYVQGQQRYLETCTPAVQASCVVCNEDLENPAFAEQR